MEGESPRQCHCGTGVGPSPEDGVLPLARSPFPPPAWEAPSLGSAPLSHFSNSVSFHIWSIILSSHRSLLSVCPAGLPGSYKRASKVQDCPGVQARQLTLILYCLSFTSDSGAPAACGPSSTATTQALEPRELWSDLRRVRCPGDSLQSPVTTVPDLGSAAGVCITWKCPAC